MANARRLNIRVARDEAMKVTRASIRREKLCYIIVVDKQIRYTKGRSPIVYIGTTSKGVSRLAKSAAERAEDVFALRGVRSFTVRVVSCRGRQRVKTWSVMERGLLLAFKERYGEVPRCNNHGKRMKPDDEFEYFRPRRLIRVLEELA